MSTHRRRVYINTYFYNETAQATVYAVDVIVGRLSWTVFRRYSDFAAAQAELVPQFTSSRYDFLDLFPPGQVFGRFETGFVEERRRLLEAWLQLCVDKTGTFRALRAFLDVRRMRAVARLESRMDRQTLDLVCTRVTSRRTGIWPFTSKTTFGVTIRLGPDVVVNGIEKTMADFAKLNTQLRAVFPLHNALDCFPRPPLVGPAASSRPRRKEGDLGTWGGGDRSASSPSVSASVDLYGGGVDDSGAGVGPDSIGNVSGVGKGGDTADATDAAPVADVRVRKPWSAWPHVAARHSVPSCLFEAGGSSADETTNGAAAVAPGAGEIDLEADAEDRMLVHNYVEHLIYAKELWFAQPTQAFFLQPLAAAAATAAATVAPAAPEALNSGGGDGSDANVAADFGGVYDTDYLAATGRHRELLQEIALGTARVVVDVVDDWKGVLETYRRLLDLYPGSVGLASNLGVALANVALFVAANGGGTLEEALVHQQCMLVAEEQLSGLDDDAGGGAVDGGDGVGFRRRATAPEVRANVALVAFHRHCARFAPVVLGHSGRSVVVKGETFAGDSDDEGAVADLVGLEQELAADLRRVRAMLTGAAEAVDSAVWAAESAGLTSDGDESWPVLSASYALRLRAAACSAALIDHESQGDHSGFGRGAAVSVAYADRRALEDVCLGLAGEVLPAWDLVPVWMSVLGAIGAEEAIVVRDSLLAHCNWLLCGAPTPSNVSLWEVLIDDQIADLGVAVRSRGGAPRGVAADPLSLRAERDEALAVAKALGRHTEAVFAGFLFVDQENVGGDPTGWPRLLCVASDKRFTVYQPPNVRPIFFFLSLVYFPPGVCVVAVFHQPPL